jgi:hypothetical protein
MSLHPVSTFPDKVNVTGVGEVAWGQSWLYVADIFSLYAGATPAFIACTFNSPPTPFNMIKYHRIAQAAGDTVVCKVYKGYVPDHIDTAADNSLPTNALDEANLVAQASYFCAEENFITFNSSSGYGFTDCIFNFDVDLSSTNLTAQVADVPPCFTLYMYAISGGLGTNNVSAGTIKTVGWCVVKSQGADNMYTTSNINHKYPHIFRSPEDDSQQNNLTMQGSNSNQGGAGNLYYHVPNGTAGDGGGVNDMVVASFTEMVDRALACEFFYQSKTPFGSVRSMTDSPTFMITNRAALPSLDVFSLTIGKATDPFGSGEDYYGYSSTSNGGWLGSNIGAVNQTYFTFPTTGVTKLAPNITGSDSAYGIYIYMDSLEANLPDNSFTSITANGETHLEANGFRGLSGGLVTYFWTVPNLNFFGHATAPAVGSNVTITWA